MTCGVYTITHVPSGRYYVGSSKECEKRFRAHRSMLSRGAHENWRLQQLWADGGEKFEFKVRQLCGVAELLGLEQEWLDATSPHRRLNIALNAAKPPGGIQNETHRRRLSASLRRRFATYTPEQLSARAKHSTASLTTEMRRCTALSRKFAQLPTGEMAENSRRWWAALTPEQRSARARAGAQSLNGMLTPEQRSANARRAGVAGRERSAAYMRQLNGALTPEQRSANAKRAVTAREERRTNARTP